jgi:hypothetical protein
VYIPSGKRRRRREKKYIYIKNDNGGREERKKKKDVMVSKKVKKNSFLFCFFLLLLLLLLFIMAEGGERRRRSIRLNCMGHFGRMMGGGGEMCSVYVFKTDNRPTTRKMREGVSQLDEKCRGGTPEGLTITLAVPLLLRSRRESVGTPGTFRHKKRHSFSYTGSVEAEEEEQEEMVTSIRYNTISTCLSVSLYVYQGRRMLLGGSWEGG